MSFPNSDGFGFSLAGQDCAMLGKIRFFSPPSAQWLGSYCPVFPLSAEFEGGLELWRLLLTHSCESPMVFSGFKCAGQKRLLERRKRSFPMFVLLPASRNIAFNFVLPQEAGFCLLVSELFDNSCFQLSV